MAKEISGDGTTELLINHMNQYDLVDPHVYDYRTKDYGGETIAATIASLLRYKVSQSFPSISSPRLLDIASGTGLIARFMRRELGYAVEATDLSQRMLNFLQQEDVSIPTKKGDMNETLPYEDGSFHAITTHWANRFVQGDNIGREAYRLLQPGGVFVWPFDPGESDPWHEMGGELQPTQAIEYLNILQRIGFQVELMKIPVPIAFQGRNISYPSEFLIATKP